MTEGATGASLSVKTGGFDSSPIGGAKELRGLRRGGSLPQSKPMALTAPSSEGARNVGTIWELAETERIRARHEAELAALIAAGATRTQIDAARRFIEALRRREEVMKCWIEYLDAHGSRSSGTGTG